MKLSGEAAFLLKEASEAIYWFDLLWRDVESFKVTVETREGKRTFSGFPFYDQNASETLHSEAMMIKEKIDEALKQSDEDA